jgi:nicotinamide-nucleotide amidase
MICVARKAEIIAVGTELLLGQIVNTNAQFLAQGLADLGIDVYFQTVVGDNLKRLEDAIRIAETRADILVFTGGLGPTQDDLTRDAIASYTNRNLVIHEPTIESIRAYFQTRGKVMVESNAKQALMVEGADSLNNDVGMAVGCAFEQAGTAFVLLPGPPREMKPMFNSYAVPWLKNLIGDSQALYSKMLKFAGIGESNLEHQLQDLINEQSEVTIAPYAKEGEVAIRLAVKAQDELAAEKAIAPVLNEIRDRFSNYLFSSTDQTLESTVVEQLKSEKQTIASAESITAGRIGDLLTSIPGSSAVYLGGTIVYSNDMKNQLLHIPMALLEGENAPGAISAVVVELMAKEIAIKTGATFGIAISGNAGPTAVEGKPIGLTYLSVYEKSRGSLTRELNLSGDRDTIKQRASKQALYTIWAFMNDKSIE